MQAEQFILARTGERIAGTETIDSAAFRGELIERFAEIHKQVQCEHSPGEGYLLANAVLKLKAQGPVVECGCFQGGMSAKLSIACAAAGRELVICDSFQGLPAPSHANGNYKHFSHRSDVVERFGKTCQFKEGQYGATANQVARNIKTYGQWNVCTLVPGFFSETLPNLDVSPAMVTMDVDLIESARDCLRWLWPRLVGRRFFTHEAFIETYMSGLLDEDWWKNELGEDVPETLGIGTGLNPQASCTAVLLKPI